MDVMMRDGMARTDIDALCYQLFEEMIIVENHVNKPTLSKCV